MKKFLVSLMLILMLCMVPTTAVAFAEGETSNTENTFVYYKVIGDGVQFLKENSDNIIIPQFEIPKTYYFIKESKPPKVDSQSGITYLPIAYNGQMGYVYENALNNPELITVASSDEQAKLNKTPNVAYFNKKVKLKKDFNDIKASTMLDYVGKFSNNNEVKYVFKYNGSLIKIPYTSEYFDEVIVPDHKFPEEPKPSTSVGSDVESPYNKLSKNILIVGIAIACVVMVIIIYKPSRKSKQREDYYDEEDYYEDYKDHYRTRNRR